MANANPNKVIVPNKVQKNSRRKFKVQKDKAFEYDADIEILEDGDYEVDKLSADGLPGTIDDITIRWFTNFSIKKDAQYIKQKFKVKIDRLAEIVGSSRIVIFNGSGDPYYYDGTVVDNTIELTNGDPAVGSAP